VNRGLFRFRCDRRRRLGRKSFARTPGVFLPNDLGQVETRLRYGASSKKEGFTCNPIDGRSFAYCYGSEIEF
jgi:hypothetical protein